MASMAVNASSAQSMIDEVSRWAALHDDILGLALVGSHARGEALADSDIDFVIVSSDPGRYLRNTDWVSTFGEVASVSLEAWGKVQSIRVWYRGGPEVELGVAGLDWTVTPPDAGTAAVLRAGCMILVDPDGLLERVLRSARGSLHCRVERATELDVAEWLGLAAEVGELFGADMARDPAFRDRLHRNVARRAAFCVRVGGSLAGAMLFEAGTIRWIAVAERFRRLGVARALVARAQAEGHEVRVTTFGAGHPHRDSQAAHALYLSMGFQAADTVAAPGPDGTPRQDLVWIAQP